LIGFNIPLCDDHVFIRFDIMIILHFDI